MGRPQLSALLEARGNEEQTAKVGDAPTPQLAIPPESTPETEQAMPEVEPTEEQEPTKRSKSTRAPKPVVAAVPPYLQYERKEARLRTDQLTNLTVRARQLNKTKTAGSDRITDNTLIRIAVDLLLSRANELHGGDEAELRASLGIKTPSR